MGIQHENGPAQVRRALDEALSHDAQPIFCNHPEEYEWVYVGQREILVPCGPRWEKHNVWVVEGTLRPGESNIFAVRRFYIDEESWQILLGEAYDRSGTLVNCYRAISAQSPQGGWHGVKP